jgi:hypothetical protein
VEDKVQTASTKEIPGVCRASAGLLSLSKADVLADGQVEMVFTMLGVSVISCRDCASTTAVWPTSD